jgi:hypothetical protein
MNDEVVIDCADANAWETWLKVILVKAAVCG